MNTFEELLKKSLGNAENGTPDNLIINPSEESLDNTFAQRYPLKILIFPFPLLSHYLRCHELLKLITIEDIIKYLESAGLQQTKLYKRLTSLPVDKVEILFAGNCGAVSKIQELGYETFFSEHFNPQEIIEYSKKFRFDWINLSNIERVFLSQVKAVRELSPDLIISDSSQTGRMLGEHTSTPCLALLNAYLTKYYSLTRGIPAIHPAKKFQAKTPPKIFDKIINFAESLALKKVHSPFRKLRKKSHLQKLRTYLDEYEGSYNLLCDDEKYFPQHKLPKNFSFIGPLYYGCTRDQTKLPLSSLFELNFKHRELSNDYFSPKVSNQETQKHYDLYLTMGSSGDWQSLTFLKSEVFADLKILAAGKGSEILACPHIEVRDFIEPQEILPFCKAVICHGGNGTIYQALSYNLKVFCKPNIFEQEWNVERFVALKLVERLPNLSLENKVALQSFKDQLLL